MKNVLLFLCLVIGLPSSGNGQQHRVSAESDAAARFVQAFYDWYAPLARRDSAEPASDVALKRKASCFSPELQRKLRADSLAQAKADGEVAGLDFDPFLYSQDPEGRYRVGTVILQDKVYFIEVHRMVAGKLQAKIAVTAEVTATDGHWYFVNFHYPGGPDLLGTLLTLQKSRNAPRKGIK